MIRPMMCSLFPLLPSHPEASRQPCPGLNPSLKTALALTGSLSPALWQGQLPEDGGLSVLCAILCRMTHAPSATISPLKNQSCLPGLSTVAGTIMVSSCLVPTHTTTRMRQGVPRTLWWDLPEKMQPKKARAPAFVSKSCHCRTHLARGSEGNHWESDCVIKK